MKKRWRLPTIRAQGNVALAPILSVAAPDAPGTPRRDPMSQVIAPLELLTVPTDGERAEVTTKPGGSEIVATVLVAVEGPLFVTTTV